MPTTDPTDAECVGPFRVPSGLLNAAACPIPEPEMENTPGATTVKPGLTSANSTFCTGPLAPFFSIATCTCRFGSVSYGTTALIWFGPTYSRDRKSVV